VTGAAEPRVPVTAADSPPEGAPPSPPADRSTSVDPSDGTTSTRPPAPSRLPTFGPSAVLTPANAITILRLAAAPVFVVLILLWGASWVTFSLGGVLALSDGVDGWVARRQGTTRSGAFLDPLADKVGVVGGMYAFVAKGTLSWLPVTIIAVREVAMSVYRSVMGRRGVSIPARNTAKVKTLLQDLALGLCLAPPLATHQTLLTTGIWVATVMTVFTGVQYLLDGRRASHERRNGLGGLDAGPAGTTPAA
jgi:CDP-diacylglycerol---glycerol-3-phosphate 3-phosphatidyltransferase